MIFVCFSIFLICIKAQLFEDQKIALNALFDGLQCPDSICRPKSESGEIVVCPPRIALCEENNLIALHLHHSSLSGTISSFIGGLTKLQVVELNSNYLYASLPSQIGLLSDLEVFSFEENQMMGTIPESVALLPNLRLFNASRNQLIGVAPTFRTKREAFTCNFDFNCLRFCKDPRCDCSGWLWRCASSFDRFGWKWTALAVASFFFLSFVVWYVLRYNASSVQQANRIERNGVVFALVCLLMCVLSQLIADLFFGRFQTLPILLCVSLAYCAVYIGCWIVVFWNCTNFRDVGQNNSAFVKFLRWCWYWTVAVAMFMISGHLILVFMIAEYLGFIAPEEYRRFPLGTEILLQTSAVFLTAFTTLVVISLLFCLWLAAFFVAKKCCCGQPFKFPH